MAYAPVETLESLSEDTLTTYVRTRLLGRPSAPPVVWSQGEVPEQFLVDAYALSTDEAFKVRLKQAVKRLLSSWRPGLNDDIAYGGRLIYLTGRLGVEDGDVILSRLATEPAVERLVLYDAPMKNLVLRTLLEFPGQEARQDFWEPLMHDAQYFDTAFLALSLRGPAEGLRYLPQYVQMALRTGLREAIVELRLANFIARHLWPDRLAELGSVLTRLAPDERQRVLVILQRAIPPAVEKMQEILAKSQGTSIKVVGVGGGGGNVLNTMAAAGLSGVELIAANTDLQALTATHADVRLQLGADLTRGLGSGANPAIGRRAAQEDREAIIKVLDGADIVFITAGMGGGTGTGAAPVIASIAREKGILTVGVVTKPFTFEGPRRMQQAEMGLQELQDQVDTLIVIPNQRLLEVIDKRTTLREAFKVVDSILYQAVQSISDLILASDLGPLDLAKVRTIMGSQGKTILGTGLAQGESRAVIAAHRAIESLLMEVSVHDAQYVIINITGGSKMSLHEVHEASSVVQSAAHPDAEIIFGAVSDEHMGDKIRVTVIATSFVDVTPSASTQTLSL